MSETHLEILTLGGLTVLRDGEPITDFDQREVPALLVYLASTGRAHPRESLAVFFWEHRTQKQALSKLRGALSNLRDTVGPFVMADDPVSMNPESAFQLDATTFEGCIEGTDEPDITRYEEAAQLYQGDFLDGFYVESGAFEHWMETERQRLEFHAIAMLDAIISWHLRQRDYTSGIAYAIQLMNIDPLREETHRHLMELYALSSQRIVALEQFETCRRMLDAEFGVEPSPRTQALYDRIRAGELDPPRNAQQGAGRRHSAKLFKDIVLAQIRQRQFGAIDLLSEDVQMTARFELGASLGSGQPATSLRVWIAIRTNVSRSSV